MFKRKFMMGGIATLAMVVVVGSGFAVWNFETSDDASKGIYNLGLYVTPNVETVGTVSTNNDYALILDQGALPELKMVDGENSSSVRESLAENADYYKRGIYVGKLKRNSDALDDFVRLPNGSIDYDQIGSVNGFWIQEISDAQSVVAENINQMEFTTKIKIRQDLAKYVQVRNDENTSSSGYNPGSTLETEPGVEVPDEKSRYVTYTYSWGSLNDVLKLQGEKFRITKTFAEIADMFGAEGKFKETSSKDKNAFYKAMAQAYSASSDFKKVDGDVVFPESDWNYQEGGNLVNWKDEAPAVDVLQNAFRQYLSKEKGYTGTIEESDCYNTTSAGLTLRGHKALKTYMRYNKSTYVVDNFFGSYADATNSIDNGYDSNTQAVSIAYFMYYKTSGVDLSKQDSFSNEQVMSSDDEPQPQYTEITTTLFDTLKEGPDPKYTEEDEKNYITFGETKIEVVDCYYFEYKLDTSNYGADGNKNLENTMQYENIKFIYYPYSYNASDEDESGIKDKLNSEIVNLDDNLKETIAFIRKPATGDEYDDMLKNIHVDLDPDTKQQKVDLSMKYVVIEFGSNLTVSGSGIRS